MGELDKSPKWIWWIVGALLITGILLITLDRKKRGGELAQQQGYTKSSQQHEETFSVNAGEKKYTIYAGPGTYHSIQANKPFKVVSQQPDGSPAKVYTVSAGSNSWRGGAPEGLLEIQGIENGTEVKFTRVK